jgi:hypothetical protein
MVVENKRSYASGGPPAFADSPLRSALAELGAASRRQVGPVWVYMVVQTHAAPLGLRAIRFSVCYKHAGPPGLK